MNSRYIAGRLIQTVFIVWLVTVLTFILLTLSPGDPLQIQLEQAASSGSSMSEEQVEALRERLGLNDNIVQRYATWVEGLVTGDWGTSTRTRQPVFDALVDRAPVTIMLAMLSSAFAISVAVPVGVLAALRRNSLFDRIATIGALTGVAMPNIWLGLLVILLFSVQLGWLPPSGYVSLTDDFIGSLKHMILPAFVLGTSEMATITRQTRSSMLEVIRQDYVRTARAKGLGGYTVIVHHALRNALLPVTTILGFRFGGILSGSVIVETIFALPGMGRLAVQAIFVQDYYVTMAFVMIVAVAVALANLLTDLMYTILDPRIQMGRAGVEA